MTTTSFATPELPRRSATTPGAACALLTALLLAAPSPANAGGSIPLSEILTVAKSATDLQEAVDQALAAAKTSEEDVTCSATRLGRHFESLGGARIAPYQCEIGGRILDIDAKVRMLDAEGRELDIGGDDTPAKAAKVETEGFTFRWRDKGQE